MALRPATPAWGQGGCRGRRHRGPGRPPERDAQASNLLERTHDPARVLALSDGVFAVVITLLVLEVHVPELTQGHSLAEALREVRPSFNAFVVTFILTGMYWVGHRDLFALVRRTDRGLVWLNILHLLPVCLLPFGASLLAPTGGNRPPPHPRPGAGRDRGPAGGDLVVGHQPAVPAVAAAR